MRNLKYPFIVILLIVPLLVFGQRKKRRVENSSSNTEYPFGKMIYNEIGYYNNGSDRFDINRVNVVFGYKHSLSSYYQSFEIGYGLSNQDIPSYDVEAIHSYFEYGFGKSFKNLITLAHTLKYRVRSYRSIPTVSQVSFIEGINHGLIFGTELGIIRKYKRLNYGLNVNLDFFEFSADHFETNDPTVPVRLQSSSSFHFGALTGANIFSVFIGVNISKN